MGFWALMKIKKLTHSGKTWQIDCACTWKSRLGNFDWSGEREPCCPPAKGLHRTEIILSDILLSFGKVRNSACILHSRVPWIAKLKKKVCSFTLCGVTWEPLTYCLWAILQTSQSKFWLGAGPKLKYLTTAWHTQGWVWGNPYLEALISSFLAMFCLRKESRSSSWTEMVRTLAAILRRKGKPWGVTWSPHGGRNAG